MMKKKKKVTQHKSSIGELDANIVVLLVWLGPIVLNAVFSNINYLGIIVPLAFLLLERESQLVRNHAGQALALYIATGVLYFILSFIGILFAGGAYYTASAGGSVDIFKMAGLGIAGFLVIIPTLVQLVFLTLACIKGWNWQNYYLPLIGDIGEWFTQKIKLK